MSVLDKNIVSSCMYAIILSSESRGKLPNAVACLSAKYEKKWPGRVVFIEHSGDPISALEELQKLRPSYCCFMAAHSECSKKFVARIHLLTREIDPSNPYYDTVWGILTGLTEEDILFSLQQEPLVIRRVLAGTPVDLSKFESGVWYNEGKKGDAHRRNIGSSEVLREQCPGDASEEIVRELSARRDRERGEGVDLVVTSGHATEHHWRIGYSFESGKLVSKEGGRLCGLTLDGKLIPVTNNRSPKVYSAAGNCLMGHVSDDSCMALSWMHSAGVVQMTGYTDVTWFGYAGWGVHTYLIDNPGSMTFSEAFHANQQSLIARLHREYPKALTREETVGAGEEVTHECSGLLYDQDKLAFYGDPAYEARLLESQESCSYITSMTVLQGANEAESEWTVCRLSVHTKCHGKFHCTDPSQDTVTFPRPPVFLLPCMMREVKIVEGEAVANCRSALLPLNGEYLRGKTLSATIAFKL